MQRMVRLGARVFLEFVDLLVQPGHHIAVMQQQGLRRRVIVTQLVQPCHQHILVRQRALAHPLRKRLVLDFGHPAKLRIVVPFHLGKRAQQLVELDHAVEGRQRAAADHFLQRMARPPNQLDHAGKGK
jgi:hypothetical protein